MKKTKAQYLFGKFEKLERLLKTHSAENPVWLNNVLFVFNSHTNLDTMKQCADALHADFDSAVYGNLEDCMIKANDLYKQYAKLAPVNA